MRKELLITWEDEIRLMDQLVQKLLDLNINASNTVIVTVSTDYSSVIGQYLRHQLTYDGEICEGFGVDVPYPDQTFDQRFKQEVYDMFHMHSEVIRNKSILLVEAGVIRGGNYTTLVDLIKNDLNITEDVKTLTMYENRGSKFKSNFVGEYYDDTIEDLTFWWERENNHWR